MIPPTSYLHPIPEHAPEFTCTQHNPQINEWFEKFQNAASNSLLTLVLASVMYFVKYCDLRSGKNKFSPTLEAIDDYAGKARDMEMVVYD